MKDKKHKKSKEEEEKTCEEYVQSETKIKKKNKREHQELVYSGSEQVDIEPSNHKKKKKKKKPYAANSEVNGSPDQMCEALAEKGSSRKKKKHKTCQDELDTAFGRSEDQNDQIHNSGMSDASAGENELEHKKRRKKKRSMTVSTEAGSISATIDDDELHSKEKKRKVMTQCESAFLEEKPTSAHKRKKSCPKSTEVALESDEMQMQSKKKEKKRAIENGCQYIDQGGDICDKKEKGTVNYKGKTTDQESGSEKIAENGSDVLRVKSKKNKRKKHSKSVEETEVIEISVDDIKGSKKKRQQKEENDSDEDEGGQITVNQESASEKMVANGSGVLHVKSKKKRKKHSKSVEETEVNDISVDDLKGSKKNKRRQQKEENDTAEDQVGHLHEGKKIIVKESTVNNNMPPDVADDTTICGPVKSKSMPTTFGQWGTAGFESSGRQDKFLRLLGGFKSGAKGGNVAEPKKKGLYGSLFTGSGRQSGTYAMGLEQQKDLENKLTHQYEQALGLRLDPHRGGGLGYERPPEEGKKFYINKSISKSQKFD